MSFIILLLLLLFVFATRLLQWRKTSYFLSLVLLSSFLLVGTGLIPRYLLDDLQANYESKPYIQW